MKVLEGAAPFVRLRTGFPDLQKPPLFIMTIKPGALRAFTHIGNMETLNKFGRRGHSESGS